MRPTSPTYPPTVLHRDRPPAILECSSVSPASVFPGRTRDTAGRNGSRKPPPSLPGLPAPMSADKRGQGRYRSEWPKKETQCLRRRVRCQVAGRNDGRGLARHLERGSSRVDLRSMILCGSISLDGKTK